MLKKKKNIWTESISYSEGRMNGFNEVQFNSPIGIQVRKQVYTNL